MRIGVSTAVMYPQTTESSIEKLLEAGFDLFELFYNCDEEISEPFISGIKKQTENASFLSIHPYTAFAEAVLFFSGYERRTLESVQKYKKVFETAKELGAKYFTFHGDRAYVGSLNGGCGLTDENVRVLSHLADTAKECGIVLCLENVSWCKSADIAYLKAVAERVENIGFTLDLKQARRADVPYSEYLAVMGDKLRNIHVSDYNKEHNCILPGKGEFDFVRFGQELKAINYSGDILIEVYSEAFSDVSEISRSKEFLQKIFSNITNM